ncbi:DUF4386 domain-containing protein [Octadecabacter sp. 1_MG-2023]|uniref:DUF4386 domain-containing protein n=1 Tax=unclassified Octadecabacter TaxID=196158 RepID=UPI001C086569|nr:MULTISPECIES: DUF4386 domain-containing protein [unclassified Octadecabacter]MBU2993222.1 DUF4386 domain-containing protein [Octadecabacter sp. B2R22]MDO6733324.1 DUF4386 domain-containing protein [Octadecabacter sp. 1_MG-2023]
MTSAFPSHHLPRLAGAFYLAIACVGGFSIGYVPQAIVVAGDAATTASNLSGNLGLFKLGVLADIFVILFEIALTAILFVMFQRDSPVLSSTAMIARAGMAIVMGLNVLIWVMPLTFLNDLSAHTDQMMMFFDAHALGIFVWQLFFGVHLLALGAAILRTGLAPKLLGWGLFVGAFGYLAQGIAKLMFIEVLALNIVIIGLLVIVTLAELSFAAWLMIWGPNRFAVTNHSSACQKNT